MSDPHQEILRLRLEILTMIRSCSPGLCNSCVPGRIGIDALKNSMRNYGDHGLSEFLTEEYLNAAIGSFPVE